MTRQGLDIQSHKQILIKILLDVFKILKEKVGFKGGTCALLFYDLPRFSLDLDFDILVPLSKEDIDDLKSALQKHGRIKQFHDKRFTTFFLIDYEAHTPNIKIELNKRVSQNDHYKIIRFLGVEMQIVDKATLLTNKMIALANRKQAVARDLFDVYYLLGLGLPLNEKIIKEKTGKDLSDYLRFLSVFIKKNYSRKNVLHGLGEVLDDKQKEWAKKNLVEAAIKEIKRIENRK